MDWVSGKASGVGRGDFPRRDLRQGGGAGAAFPFPFCVHGHQVGGTNPSLVEAPGAGNAVLAHDNPYNRWVAGEGGVYFSGEDGCAQQIVALLGNPGELTQLQHASQARHAAEFTWDKVLGDYEKLLLGWV